MHISMQLSVLHRVSMATAQTQTLALATQDGTARIVKYVSSHM